ncbi:hypothetical protein XdyCFBP7245_00770 [Xanthomonas dyei]|uniref:Uncharacterized protein n=1 Tax=Xanthomonas dyei TaxID=743699 RepID=A0A2S7CBQ4_9XANT|nr:hypothetical protein XdyCFBP7245_00770 [Xanthomonas dyei]
MITALSQRMRALRAAWSGCRKPGRAGVAAAATALAYKDDALAVHQLSTELCMVVGAVDDYAS